MEFASFKSPSNLYYGQQREEQIPWTTPPSNSKGGSFYYYEKRQYLEYSVGNRDSMGNEHEHSAHVQNFPTLNAWQWTWDKTMKSIVLSPIVVFTILGNFLVLFAFLTKKKDLRAPTHYFIANLALADFLVGIFAMPFLAVLQSTDRWYFGQGFCYAWVIIHFWLCSASILSTLGVCFERYVGVKYPLRHVEIMGFHRVCWMLAGIWALAGFLTLLSILPFPEPPVSNPPPFSCRLNNQLGHVLIATIAILYIPAILMIVLYWRIYILATNHLKAMKTAREGHDEILQKKESKKLSLTQIFSPVLNSVTKRVSDYESKKGIKGDEPSMESGFSSCEGSEIIEVNKGHRSRQETGSESSNGSVSVSTISQSTQTTIPRSSNSNPTTTASKSNAKQKQINLSRRLAFLVGILLISYVPFFTAFLLRGFDPSWVPNTFFSILGWIRYGNSAINPVIYAWAVPAYRKAFEGIFVATTQPLRKLCGG